jgi:phosphoglycerate dehydrogenase-like enzyme
MTTAGEEEILYALKYIWSRLKIVVEPSSAVALAPLLSGRYDVKPGSRIGILVSGGNIDLPAGVFKARLPEPEALRQPDLKSSMTGLLPASATDERPRILLSTPIDKQALETLKAAGEVVSISDIDEEELIARIGDFQALLVGPKQRVSSHVMKYGLNLKAIGVIGGNLENIDVSTARSLGIAVCTAPNSRAVVIAEHTVGRLLELANLLADDRLAGKTLGLIGFGLVGRQVALRASAFDMQILVNQPRLTPELALEADIEATDLLDLLRQSDFISLHLPFGEETQSIISEEALRQVRPTAFLINMGHTDLVDESALLWALNNGRLAGAALSKLPPEVKSPAKDSVTLRRHPRVIVKPHVSAVIDDQRRDASLTVARQVASAVTARRANETLNLEVVSIDLVAPHEHIDHKRVSRLMERLEEDGRLVNPPITTYWKGRYVILDGATRYSSLQRLNYPHIIVQVVDKDEAGFQLHTWYHAISAEKEVSVDDAYDALLAILEKIDGVILSPLNPEEARSALERPRSLCYFSNRYGRLTLAEAAPEASRLNVMNAIVDTYNAWGVVERTLLTDTGRLMAQFPRLVAVAIFPQFEPEEVFDAAALGDLLPAGLTRFVIPGRILRLNADLKHLKSDVPLAEKRAWLNDFLTGKLSRSRLRVYQEPVTLLDE